MGSAGRGAGSCCTDTPEEVIILEDEDEEEPCVLEESSPVLATEVLRLNVSPRSFPTCAAVSALCPPPP